MTFLPRTPNWFIFNRKLNCFLLNFLEKLLNSRDIRSFRFNYLVIRNSMEFMAYLTTEIYSLKIDFPMFWLLFRCLKNLKRKGNLVRKCRPCTSRLRCFTVFALLWSTTFKTNSKFKGSQFLYELLTRVSELEKCPSFLFGAIEYACCFSFSLRDSHVILNDLHLFFEAT